MGDSPPFRRQHKGRLGPYRRPVRQKSDGWDNPVIVGGFFLLAVYSVVNLEMLPTEVQGLIRTSRDLGRENSPPAGAFYPNCDAARAAGVAPLYAGEPGYRELLDGDSDRVACEPYRS